MGHFNAADGTSVLPQANGTRRKQQNGPALPNETNGNVLNGGHSEEQNRSGVPLARAEETSDLIDAVKKLIIPFIRSADHAATMRGSKQIPGQPSRTALIDEMTPKQLTAKLDFFLPDGEGHGRDGLLEIMQRILQCSVNTWDQGFLDKLTSSTNAVGVVSELLLAVLNTNVHVYHVSPALTLIEKHTARAFASQFGLSSPHAGGITCPGGSASNMTALVIAKNILYPETKTHGNGSHRFAVFTSEHGHYSVQKAAMICGMGMESVVAVASDTSGRMDPAALRKCILQSKEQGKTPLFVNATAGTTVQGAYDPLPAISALCKEYGLWFHVDGSWGGAAIFSRKHRHKLEGCHLADSLTVNPHKLLNVPMTCSFLLTDDIRKFHQANTLPADYLYHPYENKEEVWDLGDLTLQCGRRADSLKLALSWIHHGTAGFESWIDNAFDKAAYLCTLLETRSDFTLVSPNPPPCGQVCFYYRPINELDPTADRNTEITVTMVKRLVSKGFMTDYASGPHGLMFRVVFAARTLSTLVEDLLSAMVDIGETI